jgi:DNA-binding response OmpR family regulator
MTRILVIEDEPDIQSVLRYNLQREGFQVVVASTGQDGLHELRRQTFDLVLLDRMLPDRDGADICRSVRASKQTAAMPVIMVTAKGDETDVVMGLALGADDYVVKPFRVKELVARVKARLARKRVDDLEGDKRRVEVGELVIDPLRHEVRVAAEARALTLTEFRLLHFLASHPGIAYSRYELLENIGGGDATVTDRTIDVHVRNLRVKIRPYDERIETVRGIGYRFGENHGQ